MRGSRSSAAAVVSQGYDSPFAACWRGQGMAFQSWQAAAGGAGGQYGARRAMHLRFYYDLLHVVQPARLAPHPCRSCLMPWFVIYWSFATTSL
jgi:hypothetical protein